MKPALPLGLTEVDEDSSRIRGLKDPFFPIGVFFHDHSRNTGQQGKEGHFFNYSLPLPPAS